MAFSRRRGFRGSRGKPIHPTKWCSMLPVAQQGGTGSSQVIEICTAAELEEFTNPTVVRVRGSMRATLLRTAPQATETITVALAIGLLDQQAITAGDLLQVSPYEGPWMWVDTVRLRSHLFWYPMFNSSGAFTNTATGSISNLDTTKHWEVDIKAMRRAPQNTRLVLAYTWVQSVGSPELLVSCRFRALIKE